MKHIPSRMILAAALSIVFSIYCPAQMGERFEKERYKEILALVKETFTKNYYDPTFRNIDVEAKYKDALARIDTAGSVGQLNGIIAQFLVDFDDSHLRYLPPGKANKIDYGFRFQMIGSRCLITTVKPDSDAEKKGLAAGDELLALNQIAPSRENLWKLRYYFFMLRPQPELKVAVSKTNGTKVEFTVTPKVTAGKLITQIDSAYFREAENAYDDATRQYFYGKDPNVFIWRMPGFNIDPGEVNGIIGRAKKFPAMIFDLRGNHGGRVDMLLRLIGGVFSEDIKVADEKRRKGTREIIAKTRAKDAYTGKIVVLVDSDSASASEVFAKVVQLEKRGSVLGDRTAGAVMESRFFTETVGLDVVTAFGTSVTVADLIMKDGKSLEKLGVTPDVPMVPSPTDVASKRDVVMAKALESVGVAMTPEAAGLLFAVMEKPK